MIAAENRIRLKASPRFAHSTRSKITLAIPRDLTAWPDFRGDRVVPATRNTWQKTGIGGGTGIDSFRSKRGISSVLPSGGEWRSQPKAPRERITQFMRALISKSRIVLVAIRGARNNMGVAPSHGRSFPAPPVPRGATSTTPGEVQWRTDPLRLRLPLRLTRAPRRLLALGALRIRSFSRLRPPQPRAAPTAPLSNGAKLSSARFRRRPATAAAA
jgi:hypothetical protein